MTEIISSVEGEFYQRVLSKFRVRLAMLKILLSLNFACIKLLQVATLKTAFLTTPKLSCVTGKRA